MDDNSLFSRFKDVMRATSFSDVDDRLLLDRAGAVSVYYAPFDFINGQARVVIVGITPGKTQMLKSLSEARRLLNQGLSDQEVRRQVKKAGAFSGPMRPNLVALLDQIGIHRWLGISGCSELFAGRSELVQTASILMFPVFVGGTNYNGSPNAISHPLLRRYLLNYFGRQCDQLRDAIFVPLGDKVCEALRFLCSEGLVDKSRVLEGVPHPSPANGERIAFFLGKKGQDQLSAKTDGRKLEHAKRLLREQIGRLR